jgi:hypothetical protein
MSGIKQPIQDVLSRLAAIPVQNQDLQNTTLYTRIFNNQPKLQSTGKIQAYPLPAAFVEVISPARYNRLLNGVAESDIVFRIHLQHWFTDAQDGTFDQDLPIFDLRDAVIGCLANHRPTNCGNLCFTAESQDYSHYNTYEYLLEFTTAFTDGTGSPYNTGPNNYLNSIPPIMLDLEIDEVAVING